MIIFNTLAELQTWRYQQHNTVGFVPTMGALHQGHLALMATAKQQCHTVIASIFVNPIQFGITEDLNDYPRPREKDIALLQQAGVDAAWLPTVNAMYPHGTNPDNLTRIMPPAPLQNCLCGAVRPGHLEGVATVVNLLFQQTRPTHAFFGEKDYQQLIIIKRMIADFQSPITIYGMPTVREADGLALSSRNAYLTTAERAIAPFLYKTLLAIKTQGLSIENGKKTLIEKGFSAIDYLEFRHSVTLELLQPSEFSDAISRLFVAARLGKTRLIDNI